MRRTHRLTTIALGGMFALALTGCGGVEVDGVSVDKDGDKVTVKTDEGEATIDVNGEDGEFSVESEDGSFAGGSELPDDFPSDEVPLVDGTVLSGFSSSSDGTEGYSVAMTADGSSASEVGEEAIAKLTAAGFEKTSEFKSGETEVYALTSDAWEVSVQVAGADDGEVTITYTVGTTS